MGTLKRSSVLLAVLVACCGTLMACSAPPAPPPPEKTVFDPLKRDMDRARDVQKTVNQHADDTRKNVDAQERGDDSQSQ